MVEKLSTIYSRGSGTFYGTEGRGADIGRILEEHVFIRNDSAIERFNCETIGLVQGKVACDKDNDVPDLGAILTKARRRLTYDGMPGRRTLYTPWLPPNWHRSVSRRIRKVCAKLRMTGTQTPMHACKVVRITDVLRRHVNTAKCN